MPRGDSTSPYIMRDDFTSFISTHTTLAADTNTSINLSTRVRMYRVINWSTSSRVLISVSTIANGSDGSASRLGFAPSASIPNSDVWPITSTTINLLSTSNIEVTVEAFTFEP